MNKLIILLMLFIMYNILTTKQLTQNIKVDTSIIHPASIKL